MLRSFVFGLVLYTSQACSAIEDHLGKASNPKDTNEIIIEIPKGTTAGSLGTILAKANVIDSADNFKNYIRLSKKGGCTRHGKQISICSRRCTRPFGWHRGQGVG